MERISELFSSEEKKELICEKDEFLAYKDIIEKKEKYKVNILAMGDVGSTLLLGLKLLGADVIEEIGIFDLEEKISKRYEMEMNQIAYPFALENNSANERLPKLKVLEENEIFDCDVFLFCPSVMVPKVDKENKIDVRMVQYEGNKKLVEIYAQKAIEKNYKGIFAVVSDPVDPLCQSAVNTGMDKKKIKGFGLGVMNARALYFSEKNEKFKEYENFGRAYGPHGQDLVIANNIQNYDDRISKELTKLTVNANLDIRSIGFKPYIAPALSSGAISVIKFLRGEWHYSSLSFGEAFLGIKNKVESGNAYFENLKLDIKLLERIENALNNLKKISKI